MKMLYARVVTKAALNTQRTSTSTIARKERPQKIWFNPPLTQTVKTNVAKSFFRLLDNIFLSLTYDTRSLTETPSKLVIVYVQCITDHKATQQECL